MYFEEQLKKNKFLNKIYDDFFCFNKNWIDILIKEVKNDHDFYKKITKIFDGKIDDNLIVNNLSSILKFKEDLSFCKKCPGFEKCEKNIKHYKYVLKKNNQNHVSYVLEPCEEKLKILKSDELYTIEKFNYLSPFRDFPFSWHFSASEISKLDKSNSRLILIKEYKKVIDNKKNGLFIYGSYHSGKSFVAVALLNNLIFLKKPEKVVFINCANRIKYLQEIYSNNRDEFDDLIRLYSNVEILVLDDLVKSVRMNLFVITLFLKF